ncbi:MAG: hypothetical protein NC299_10370 [Lachnospiraceae bacterium]|nr:hypothetical protein [Ruminococcus sp.]MCM1275752.1 hypothetical protein [Lachnospiraceae bacterium]
MTSQQFLQTTKQLNQLREYTNSAIMGKNKSGKIDIINRYIESIAELVLQSYIEDSTVIWYKQDGREFVDIIHDHDKEHIMRYFKCYSGYRNFNWDGFRQKCKNILDLSRYKPTKIPDIITFCDDDE